MKLKLLVFLCFLTTPLFAQNFSAAQPFHLINIGNGAAAIGMGGAYVAIAEDLSALSWNPAGLSNRAGFRGEFDSLLTSGSEEFNVHTSETGDTLQDYSISGFQPQSLAITYQWSRGDFIFGPSFGWTRAPFYPQNFELDKPVNGQILRDPYISEAAYTFESGLEYQGTGEDIFSFGFSLKLPNKLSIGGVWNFLQGQSTEDLFIKRNVTGTRLFFLPDEEPVLAPFTSTRNQTVHTTEKFSGNFVNVGILYEQNPKISFGGTVRFGYSRKREITDTSVLDFETIGMIPSTYHAESTFGPVNIDSKLPMEFSAGVAIRLTQKMRVASSLTYGDYSPADEVNFYPTLKGSLTFQSNLIQWRNGLEYQVHDAFLLRGGWILDDQPYSKQYYPVNQPDDSPFYGYTFGGGWHSNNVAFDVAFLHENGRAYFGHRIGGISDHDVQFSDGHLSHNRLFFSVNFQR